MFTYVSSNTTLVNTNITFQVNKANTSITVIYTSGQTGIKEDTSNTATVAATDEILWTSVVANDASGATTITYTLFKIEFTPTTAGNTITVFGGTGNNTINAASTTRYFPINGGLNTAAAETSAKYRMRFAGTASNLYVHAGSNARTTNTTFGTRDTGANGTQSVTYTSGQTGTKEDTTNTDTLSVGDDFDYYVTTDTGTENLDVKVVTVQVVNTNNYFALLSALGQGSAVATGVTTYYAVAGSLISTSTTEANTQMYSQFTFTASEMVVWVSANTSTSGSCVITVRDNGAGNGLAVTYTFGQTGLLNDTDTQEITSATDEIDYQVVNSGNGTITFTQLGVLGSTIFLPAWLKPISKPYGYLYKKVIHAY
jgi:enamine deaminase RidA (YjgF/YER057c/UK114 family)